jgi:hypothetical protein
MKLAPSLLALLTALSAALALARPVQPPAVFAPASSLASPDAGASDASRPFAPAPSMSAIATTTNEDVRKNDVTAGLACSACHTTSAWKTRATGGGDDADGFDHAKTGFPLTGVHANTGCTACHVPDRPTPKRDCVSCHTDWHRGRLGTSCDKCHSAVAWKATKPVEIHRMTRFPLTGMHVLADCTQCHQKAGEHLWTGVPVDCFACHENEYRRSSLRPVHQGSATSAPFPRDCNQCHRAFAWAPAVVPASLISVVRGSLTESLTPPENHDLRFPLSFGPHRTAQCGDCHTSLANPRSVQCVGCHAHEPTRVTLQHKQPVAKSGAACLACHVAGARR